MAGRRRSTYGCNEAVAPGTRRLRYWADLHDGRGYVRHSKTIHGTRREGDEELARLRLAHAGDRPSPTVQEAWETWWLPQARDRVARGEMTQRSLDVMASPWRRHVAPEFGEVRVGDVRALDVQAWLMTLSASTAKRCLGLLRQVLNLAVMYEAVDHNVALADFRMPKTVEREHVSEVWDVAQVTEALEALRGSCAYVPAVLCALGSCRVGESLGVRVDLGEVRRAEANGMVVAIVDVNRQVTQDGAPSERLKTRQSQRPVVIPEPWSLDVLAAAEGSLDGTWLCPRGDGRPMSQRTFASNYSAALEAAGIEPIPPRNLRNSWRTFMRWELGVPEDMCEKMMGHAGKGVGEVYYDRPRAEYFAATASAAWQRYRQAES